jgi:hypothetical protein
VEHKTFSIKADYFRKIDYSAPSEASDSKSAKPVKKKAKHNPRNGRRLSARYLAR